jgi:hypothetical protein
MIIIILIEHQSWQNDGVQPDAHPCLVEGMLAELRLAARCWHRSLRGDSGLRVGLREVSELLGGGCMQRALGLKGPQWHRGKPLVDGVQCRKPLIVACCRTLGLHRR